MRAECIGDANYSSRVPLPHLCFNLALLIMVEITDSGGKLDADRRY
jgi:hypothetical protein